MNVAEQALYLHVIEPESLRFIIREGIIDDILPTEELRPVLHWCIDYFIAGGMTKAPSVAALREEFADLLDDHEVEVGEEPEETIEWAIDKLKSNYAFRQSQAFVKDLAQAMADEGLHSGRIEVLGEHASRLTSLVNDLESRVYRVEAQDGFVESLRNYEIRATTREEIRGMRFGLPAVDAHTHGIHEGELAILAAPPKTGKGSPPETLVLAPTGWRQIGDLRPGDEVIGSNGRPTEVVATVRWSDRPHYRVTTDDGGSVVVDAAHEWDVLPHGQKRATVETATIARKIQTNRRYAYLPIVEPVQYAPSPDLPLHPYLLGVLLGDGSFTHRATPHFCKPDPWIHDEIDRLLPEGDERRDASRTTKGEASIVGGGVTAALRTMGLMGCRSWEKFLPEPYLYASIEDRRMVLAGLLDTDGGVDGKSITYCSTSERLARAVRDLVLSLGGTARIKCKAEPRFQGGVGRPAWIVTLRMEGCPFRTPIKRQAYADRPADRQRPSSRRIVEVVDAGRGDTVCIQVAAPDGLYVTKDFLVTHNSYFVDHVALAEWKAGRRVALCTLENSIEMTYDRIACLANGIDPSQWQRGLCKPDEVEVVRDWVADIQRGAMPPLWIMQPPLGRQDFDAMVAEARVRDAQTIIIDQLTFVELPNSGHQSKTERIGDGLHRLKKMISSGRHPLACLLAHQINREGVRAADKVGHLEMFHLADSAEVERTADWVFGMYASRDQQRAMRATFQTLASRREIIKNWALLWDIRGGNINAEREIEFG